MKRFEVHHIEAGDGVTLRVFDRAGPTDDAPALVLSNGLGGNLHVWRHLIAHFGPTHRLVTWDYRGLYGSALTLAAVDAGISIDVPAHAADAVRIVDALDVDRAVFVGWSMGVQLNFEVARTIGDRMDGIVALSGGFGRTLSTTMVGKKGEPLLMPAMEGMRFTIERFGGPLKSLLKRPGVLGIAKRVGFIAPSLDEEVFKDLVDEYLDLDFRIYNRILALLGDHDAEDVLPGLTAPVLIIAGDRDPMTPHWLSKRMTDVIPTADLMILPRASHYAPVEFPAEINRRIDRFLDERVHPS